MFDALNNRTWVSDLKGALIVHVLIGYLQLWELLENVELQPDVAVSTPQNQPMKLFLLDPSTSVLGNRFGKAELQASASSLCGQLHTRSVGRLIT